MIRPSPAYYPPDSDLEKFWDAQKSSIVRDMLRIAKSFALSDLGVRIIGERGTGKLQLARMIHRYSSRCDGRFHYIDCAELGDRDSDRAIFGTEVPDEPGPGFVGGMIETTAGGTLYFDKFPLLPEKIRFRLSRAQELKHFRRVGGTNDIPLNLRIITGITKQPIHPVFGDGEEPGMSSWISPVSINIPPLRERRDDILPLIYLFLEEFQHDKREAVLEVTSDALDQCRYYTWPGNIHELRNVIRHCAQRCRGGRLEIDHLPDYIRYEYSRSGIA